MRLRGWKVRIVAAVAVLVMAPAVWAEHEHDHPAPPGGMLVELGEEAAHLEFVSEPDGGVRVYVLDGEAEQSVRVPEPMLELSVTSVSDAAGTRSVSGVVTLSAVASPLTGETAGDASEFTGRSDRLRAASAWSGVLDRVTVKGQPFEQVPIRIPGADEREPDHGPR
jgi:hypothetical protein